jgi:putative membrane protein
MTHVHSTAHTPWLGVAVAATLTLGYVLLVRRQRRRRSTAWPRRRTASFLVGCGLLGLALHPRLAAETAGFTAHTIQHVLIGMMAPLFVVLAEPVGLLLRAGRPTAVRRFVRLMDSRPARVLTHPFAGLLLSVGMLYLLYLTPLYRATMDSSALHHVMNAHFLLSGCLFAWSIAGRGPGGAQSRFTTRVVAVAVAVTAHAALAQVLYAGFGHVPVAPDQLRSGVTIMYYGGDLAELLLVLALLARVPAQRPHRQPAPAATTGTSRERRRGRDRPAPSWVWRRDAASDQYGRSSAARPFR